jgi:hypothetical protein
MKITRQLAVSGSWSGMFALSIALATPAHAANELTGWALMPANTFASGPTSGQFTSTAFPATNPLPLVNKQPVQGFSAVLRGPSADSFRVMPDNGFGAITNSADALLRVYAVAPRFKSFDVSWSSSAIMTPAPSAHRSRKSTWPTPPASPMAAS